MVVAMGMSWVFVIVIFLVALWPGVIFPKFSFPSVRSKPVASPTTNIVRIVSLCNGALSDKTNMIADAIISVVARSLFFLFIFLS